MPTWRNRVCMPMRRPRSPGIKSGRAVFPDGFCGSGAVIPLGHATETILFGGTCGGNCDFRTINLAGGSIFPGEFFSNPACPGAYPPNPAAPGCGTLADVIVGGTGNSAARSPAGPTTPGRQERDE